MASEIWASFDMLEFNSVIYQIHSISWTGTELQQKNSNGKEYIHEQENTVLRQIKFGAKKQIMKCLVWSVALYAAETWTLMQADRSKLEAFEMWIWKRMQRISWVEKTNEEILNMVQEDIKHNMVP